MVSKGIFVLLLVSVVVVSGCISPEPKPLNKQSSDLVLQKCEPSTTNPDTDLSKTYEEGELTLKYPSDWSKITYLGTTHFVPAGEDAGGNTALLNVEVSDSNGKSFEQYSVENIANINSINEKGVACSTTLAENPAVKFMFTNANYGKQYIHVWTVKNDKVYDVSFGAPSDSFSNYLPDIESIINAVTIS